MYDYKKLKFRNLKLTHNAYERLANNVSAACPVCTRGRVPRRVASRSHSADMLPRVALPSVQQTQEDTQQVFGITPCIGQITAALAQLEKKTDVVFISGTGSGKTLTFWIPMIYEKDSITILVTALNVLGHQTAATLQSPRTCVSFSWGIMSTMPN